MVIATHDGLVGSIKRLPSKQGSAGLVAVNFDGIESPLDGACLMRR